MIQNEDLSKTKRQYESINKWRTNKGVGILVLCPRFGKTRIGCIIAEKTNRKTLIITPSHYIADYWKSNIAELHNVNDIFVCSVNYYIENKLLIGNDFDLVIIDEIHKFTSDIRLALLVELSSIKFRLGLTGTLPPGEKEGVCLTFAPVIDRITTQEAIGHNWVSPTIHYHIPLEFDNMLKEKYIRLSKIISDDLDLFRGLHKLVTFNETPIFKSEFDLMFGCYIGIKVPNGYVEGEVFRKLVAKLMGWKPNIDTTTEYGKQREKYWHPANIYERCKGFKESVRARNDLVNCNFIKLNKVLEIIQKFPISTIVFNESNEFTSLIADRLGHEAIAYHSSIESRPIWDDDNNDWFRYKTGLKKGQPKVFGKDKIKEEVIQGMISGKYKYLITTKSLDDGLTIPNLEQVIITAGSTNPIQHEQRSARGATINFLNPNKQTKIFNLYFKDILLSDGTVIPSRDKTKLKIRQTENFIKMIDLNEIS